MDIIINFLSDPDPPLGTYYLLVPKILGEILVYV